MAARKGKTCITATLTRGRVYVYDNVHYMRGVPSMVEEDLAERLEELCEEVTDSDGDTYDKFLFEIDDNAPMPQEITESKKPRIRRNRVAESAGKQPLRRRKIRPDRIADQV